jgi:hypothetical protein
MKFFLDNLEFRHPVLDAHLQVATLIRHRPPVHDDQQRDVIRLLGISLMAADVVQYFHG